MQDDFELVKRKRQRKRKTKLEVSPEEAIHESQVCFNRKFQGAVEEFKSSRFCFELFQSIENCIKCVSLKSVSQILCYGIGNFFESKSSLHQLAALLEINKKYKSQVTVYDPVFSALEITALNKFNFKVLHNNEEGKRKVTGDQITLVFFPHCPIQLVNNFLWANWNITLCKCILITNSFLKIIEDNTQKVLQRNANYIVKIYQKTIEIPLEDCYKIENVFNDLSIHYFQAQDLDSYFFTETLCQEPVYGEETELITKTLENLDIKNEL